MRHNQQKPVDLGFLVLGLFCVSPVESFEVAGYVLALLHAQKADGTASAEVDVRETDVCKRRNAEQPVISQFWLTPAENRLLLL
jgi:hypothetical protein